MTYLIEVSIVKVQTYCIKQYCLWKIVKGIRSNVKSFSDSIFEFFAWKQLWHRSNEKPLCFLFLFFNIVLSFLFSIYITAQILLRFSDSVTTLCMFALFSFTNSIQIFLDPLKIFERSLSIVGRYWRILNAEMDQISGLLLYLRQFFTTLAIIT